MTSASHKRVEPMETTPGQAGPNPFSVDEPLLASRVAAAQAQARAIGFSPCSCRDVTGAVLAALAAARPGARIGEAGTGVGVGAAWLTTGMDRTATLVTVEYDLDRATAAMAVLGDDPRVTVRHASWEVLKEYAPFDLLFVDFSLPKDQPDVVVDLLALGGTVLLDDYTPSLSWPPVYAGEVDTQRLAWLQHPRLHTVEVTLANDLAVLVATRTH